MIDRRQVTAFCVIAVAIAGLFFWLGYWLMGAV